jgi:hypothetical protein
MYTADYLRNLKAQTENERKENPLDFAAKKYRDGILACAKQGGKRYEIIDIHESHLEIIKLKLREIFIDINIKIDINEYNNPNMPLPQKSIIISW